MDRDHRLELEDVLRAFVRPDVEVGVVLERQDSEIADRILRFLGNIILVRLAYGIVIDALGFVRHRLLGVPGSKGDGERRDQSRERELFRVGDRHYVSCPLRASWQTEGASGRNRHVMRRNVCQKLGR